MSDTVRALEQVGGHIPPEAARNILRWEQERQRRLAAAFFGIKALVKLYYDNYTDATDLEEHYVHQLLNVMHEGTVGEELVFEAIREAEAELNRAGGLVSDSDGSVHQVRTPMAYVKEG